MGAGRRSGPARPGQQPRDLLRLPLHLLLLLLPRPREPLEPPLHFIFLGLQLLLLPPAP